jgi:hypothetical protein
MENFSNTPPAPPEPESIELQTEPTQPAPPEPEPIEVQTEPIEPVQPADSQTEPIQPVQPADSWPRVFVLGLVVAFVFILGLGIGFLGRPVIINDLPIEVVVTVVSDPASQAVAQTNAPNPTTAAPAESVPTAAAPTSAAPAASSPVEAPESTSGTTTEDPAATALPTPTIMDFVLSDARHFQGDDNAPVTMVEFSDFK